MNSRNTSAGSAGGTLADDHLVVVPLDGTPNAERAIVPAMDLAGRIGSMVRLVSAVDDDAAAETQLAYLRATAAALHDPVGHTQPNVEVRTDPGVVSTLIDDRGHNATVCMATSASIFHLDHYTGSMAEKVVRRSHRPTILIGPNVEDHTVFDMSRIVVSVDGSERSEAAVPIGMWCGAALDVPVWLVQVFEPGKAADMQSAVGSGDAIDSAYLRNLAQEHRIAGVSVQWENLHSKKPAHALVEYAGDDGLLVMATHGRTGLSRLTLGSVTTHAVKHAERPVLVTCPEGLVDEPD
jgi:nucleotide-binding universal stress UspA family protein